MNHPDSKWRIYRVIFTVGIGALLGGIAAGIYESIRTVGRPPNISYQVLQDQSIAQLERNGKYTEAVVQKRLAAKYNSPFQFMKNGTARDYGEMCLAWYAEGDRSGDSFCYHRSALNFLRMQDRLLSGDTRGSDAELMETQARLAELAPIRTGKWSLSNPRFIGKLAWTMATSTKTSERNVPQALKYATTACELSGFPDAWLLDTLAVAYAADGNFENAIATAQSAIEHAPATGASQQDIDAMKKRLALYQRGRSYVASATSGEAGY